jgi:hypothetical protein
MDIYNKGDRIMGKLREQMQADLQLRGITPRTQATYLREVGTGKDNGDIRYGILRDFVCN